MSAEQSFAEAEARAERIESIAAKYASRTEFGEVIFPGQNWMMFVADLATPAPGAPGQEAAAVQAVAQETDRDWSKAQDWKGMDGATAFLLINRHSDGWGDVGAMMNAWLAANAAGEKP